MASSMKIRFHHRLVVRLWLAVVLAVVVLSLLVAWLMRMQAERIRGERLAEIPAREVILRDAAGQVIAQTTVQPVRVPGRGVEFHIELPPNVQGGQQLAIALPPRQRGSSGPAGSAGGAGFAGAPPPGPPDRLGAGGDPQRWLGRVAPFGLAGLLVFFALAVALGSYPVMRRLTQRLEQLQRGVERFGAGDLRSRVKAEGQDEVAFLARRFNRSADQIEALVQAQKSLLANASHELRSPLARIRMGLELMETSPSSALKAELSRNIAELDLLIDEILLASRLEARQDDAPDGVTHLATESVDMLALAAEEGARVGAELNWAGQSAAQAVMPGDARLLRRLMRNLLENAQRHGGQDVKLELFADADAVRLEVLDRGPGVPVDERERIFEAFYRSSQASERHGGVGLGLSLVRTIAGQHGGNVQCRSRDGGGARFVVTLPLRRAAASAPTV
jgi:two-component system, OmpR family, sensor kinase